MADTHTHTHTQWINQFSFKDLHRRKQNLDQPEGKFLQGRVFFPQHSNMKRSSHKSLLTNVEYGNNYQHQDLKQQVQVIIFFVERTISLAQFESQPATPQSQTWSFLFDLFGSEKNTLGSKTETMHIQGSQARQSNTK